MSLALLSRAKALAWQGRYENAELVLESLPHHSPEALDLLARIRAQQGLLREAATLWAEASRIEPGNSRIRR